MWHHKIVLPLSLSRRDLLLALLLCNPLLRAQSHPQVRPTPAAHTATAPDPAQGQALQNNDPAQVSQATQPLLEKLTTAHPTHAQAQYQLGKALLEQEKTSDAIPHLELAAKNDPAPDYIHYQLGTAYRKAGRTADADRELTLYRDIKARNRQAAPQPH